MNSYRPWLVHVPPIILATSLAGVYLSTIAPGLTWANDGSDGGDLITAAVTGGIAHPTGYPLYLLLARLFQLLPVGSLAFRTNLLSAVMTVLAAVLVYGIVTRSLITSGVIQVWPAGLAAGYAFGLAPLIWSQAVITEVYALQSFLVLVILYLYIQPVQTSITAQKRQDRLRGLWLGLALGNHLTTLLLFPVALWIGSFRRRDDSQVISASRPGSFRNWRLDGNSLRRQLAWMGMGSSIYLLLPFWALSRPPINWGNPLTPGRLWWLVSGQLYQSYYLQTSLAEIGEHLQSWATLLLVQFGLPGLVLGLTGLFVFGMPSHLHIFTSWMAAVSLTFGLIYGSADYYVYLIPMFISFAIWIGLGIIGLVQQFPPRFSKWGWGLGVLLVIYFTSQSFTQVSHVDASRDLRAESFGMEVLSVVPQDAIIFAGGDESVFTLWYFHFALGKRPDLAVLATDLLHFDWYQENLHYIYPSLVVPAPFPWPESIRLVNPARAVCYVEYVEHAEIECVAPVSSSVSTLK